MKFLFVEIMFVLHTPPLTSVDVVADADGPANAFFADLVGLGFKW